MKHGNAIAYTRSFKILYQVIWSKLYLKYIDQYSPTRHSIYLDCGGNPIESQCKGNYDWKTPGCHLKCENPFEGPSYIPVKQWCDLLKIAKQCQPCPSKNLNLISKQSQNHSLELYTVKEPYTIFRTLYQSSFSLIVREEDFLAKFGDLVIKCNATDQYIWKDQICDGKQDCLDSEDETNCNNSKIFTTFNLFYDAVFGSVHQKHRRAWDTRGRGWTYESI